MAAQLGQPLPTPEPGWKRYDDRNGAIQYIGTWLYYSTSSAYRGGLTYTRTVGDRIKFFFKGTKIRIINHINDNNSDRIKIVIDDIIVDYINLSQIATQVGNIFNCLVYEKTSLEDRVHTVEIIVENSSAGWLFELDAIDIDDTGRLFHPDEVTDIKDLDIGKRIRCHYHAPTSGQVGIFSGLGEETSDFIPPTSSTTPNGDFYFICVDRDYLGRWKLIADRAIQRTSWDILNSEGIASGSGVRKRPVEYIDYTDIVYVDAVNGSDSNNGKQGSPVQSLNKAIQIAREYSIVYLSEGIYPINTVSGYLHDLCTSKHLTFIGQGLNTVIEVESCPINYQQPIGSAKFYNLVIRPSNNFSGDTRVIWYNGLGYRNFALRFYNVAFMKSLNGAYPADRYFYWANTGRYDVDVIFENCSFKLVPNGIEDLGTDKHTYINCVFENTKDSTFRGKTINCLFGVTIDDSFHNNVDNTSVGVYGGRFSWNKPSFELLNGYNNYEFTIRLLTGGVNSSDKDNEWDQYIVNSNLNGTITPGDSNVWNWSGLYSLTSTVNTSSANRRTVRGSTTVSDSSGTPSDYAHGFRPVLLIEIIKQQHNFSGNIDKNVVHKDSVTLSGTLSASDGYVVSYQVLLNNQVIYEVDDFLPTHDINITIQSDNMVLGSNVIKLVAIDNTGDSSSYWIFTVTKVNTVPFITASMQGLTLNIRIDDPDTDNVKFRIELNGNQVFPPSGYTNFRTPPVLYKHTFKSSDVNIGSLNTLVIYAVDDLGSEAIHQLEFIGEYSGLMFADSDGNYYSTDLGEVLKYLDFGGVIAGQTTLSVPIRLINKNGFKVTNIVLSNDNNTQPPGVRLEMSKSDLPFVPETELFYPIVLNYGDEITFYVRLATDAGTPPKSGKVTIFVKGDPIE